MWIYVIENISGFPFHMILLSVVRMYFGYIGA